MGKFQEERYLGILEEIMDQRRVAEHQKRDLETMVQAEKEMQARPVEEKPTVEPPVIQEEVAKHLVIEKLENEEEMREVSEEVMKEVSEEEMKEVSEEEMKEENLMETVTNSRVKHTVWRPWEEERVAELRGLVDVGEKEKVAEHLRVKLETHDGTQYPTPWQCPVDARAEGLTLAPRRDNNEEMKGEEEFWATKCKHAREATKVAEESPKEEERCQAQHMSSVRLCSSCLQRK